MSKESNDKEDEPPPSKPLEGERYGNERILFEEEEPPPSEPSGGGCNFVLSMQHPSLESDDKEEIESNKDVCKWGGGRRAV